MRTSRNCAIANRRLACCSDCAVSVVSAAFSAARFHGSKSASLAGLVAPMPRIARPPPRRGMLQVTTQVFSRNSTPEGSCHGRIIRLGSRTSAVRQPAVAQGPLRGSSWGWGRLARTPRQRATISTLWSTWDVTNDHYIVGAPPFMDQVENAGFATIAPCD